jgi:3-hydroxybutyryl-CoA dehydratase
VLGTKLPGAGAIFMSASIRFKAPVRIGDVVTALCTVREVIAEKRRVICECVCKVGNTTVIDAEAILMVPARRT